MALKRRDGWAPWCFCLWAFTLLFSFVFAVLCCYTFSEFHRLSKDEKLALPDTFRKNDWVSMFDGAAGSAFFAVLLCAIYLVVTVYYMLCSLHSLSHPQSRYGRGVVVASSFYTALHICNIAVHFTSFTRVMTSWTSAYKAQFHNSVLVATYVMGYLATAMFLAFAVVVGLWRDKPAEGAERSILSDSSHEMSHV